MSVIVIHPEILSSLGELSRSTKRTTRSGVGSFRPALSGGPLLLRCLAGFSETVAVNDVTRILDRVEQGDPKAAAELLPLVYAELRRLAAHQLSGERHRQTLQPTALVHEAWLKLSGQHREWNGRQHFFAAAAEAMRRILVDRARRRLAAKRGAGQANLELEELEIPAPAPDDELLDVNDALERFAQQDPRKAELVNLRYFVGMNFEEASEALGIAVPTAKEWWAYARAWLRVEIARQKRPG